MSQKLTEHRAYNKCLNNTQQVASLLQVADAINRFKYRCKEHSFLYTYTCTQSAG